LRLAPLIEQQEIVRRIEIALAWVDRIASEFISARKLIDHLDQAILLAKAFRGELVPQDPNDEPASVLLERIRAEREVRSPKKGLPSSVRSKNPNGSALNKRWEAATASSAQSPAARTIACGASVCS
jgi:hypothetical protein